MKEKVFDSETFCPFNKAWCSDKQKRLDGWNNNKITRAILTYAFYMRSSLFDGCPNGYKALCEGCKEKQRG